MTFGLHEEVWVLLDKRNMVQGIYAHENDCREDAEYLGGGHHVQKWAVDFQTVAVEE